MKDVTQYTISDIQLGVGDDEFNKGLNLYNKGAVNYIEKDFSGYSAIVLGSHDYIVNMSLISHDRGNCNCYLGQRDELCKHMIALAIALVYKFRPNDTKIIDIPLDQAICSGQKRDITEEEVKNIKFEIKRGLSFIKSYTGPSSKWFYYQDSLIKGSRLILLTLSKLPVCEKSADICIDLLKKLDKKLLSGGIDDSDGTIGDLMVQIVEVLNLFVSLDKNIKDYIKNNLPKGEVFDWEKGFDLLTIK